MNNYFCVLPFYGAEYSRQGFTSPCCLLPNNHNIQQIRSDMLSGKRSLACQKCWSLEDQGKTSDRQLKNSAYDFFTNKDIKFIEEDCKNGNFNQQIIKLYTSNLCNSTCVTCNSRASTAWATLAQVKTHISINDNILSNLSLKDIVMLNFVGGEPFYEKKNFDILNRLIEIGNTDALISFTTNGSTGLTAYQKDVLRRFKNLNICLSIDGVGLKFEYLRYPLKWRVLLDNIDYFKSINIDLSVSYTLSNLNILYYDETIDWFQSQNLKHNHIMVTHPRYFSPAALPLEIKKELNNQLIPVDMHSSVDEENFVDSCKEIKRQDQLKNISIENYLPEFYDIIPVDLR